MPRLITIAVLLAAVAGLMGCDHAYIGAGVGRGLVGADTDPSRSGPWGPR